MLEFYANSNFPNDSVDISIFEGTGYIEEVTFKKVPFKEGDQYAVRRPSMVLGRSEAQNLFMALWQAGHRPPQEQNVEAVVKAKDKHIEFAESVANKLLGV